MTSERLFQRGNGVLSYMGLQSVGYDLATEQQHTQESSQLTALNRH